MTDDAKSILNYTFPDLMNSTIWNNMTIFFSNDPSIDWRLYDESGIFG